MVILWNEGVLTARHRQRTNALLPGAVKGLPRWKSSRHEAHQYSMTRSLPLASLISHSGADPSSFFPELELSRSPPSLSSLAPSHSPSLSLSSPPFRLVQDAISEFKPFVWCGTLLCYYFVYQCRSFYSKSDGGTPLEVELGPACATGMRRCH